MNFNLQSKNLNRQHLCELTKNYFTLFHIFFSFYSKIPIKTHKEYTVSSHKTFSHFSLPVTPCVPLVTRKPGLLAHSVDMSVSVSHRYETLQPLPQSAQHRPLSAEALPLDNHSQSPPPFSSPSRGLATTDLVSISVVWASTSHKRNYCVAFLSTDVLEIHRSSGWR